MIIKKIFGALLLLAILTLPQNVFAEKTDYTDRNYYFRNIRAVIVLDATVSPGVDVGGTIAVLNIQEKFREDAFKKLNCRIYTEAQARQLLSAQVGMNLEALAMSNPMQARQIVQQNAYQIADAWIFANVDAWGNTTYIEPERTVWESRRETRRYYDRWGQLREESYNIQVPVTYPPRRVDISTVQVSLQVYDARTGAMVFARKDVRDREDYSAQSGMFGRISNSFYEDLAKKIR